MEIKNPSMKALALRDGYIRGTTHIVYV